MLQYTGPGLFRVHASASLVFLLLPMSLFQCGLFQDCADPKGSKKAQGVGPHTCTPLHHERPAIGMHIHAYAPKRIEFLLKFGAANNRHEDPGPSGSCIGLS